MKIVHINLSNLGGGAAIAAMRHSEALQLAGYDSLLISMKGETLEKSVVLGQGRLLRYASAIVFHIIRRIKLPGISWSLLLFGKAVHKHKDVREADVIVLHYINDFLNYRTLRKVLSSGKRVIWFMHDMWPMTGGCHYSLDCNGYTKECANCSQLTHCKWMAKWQLKAKKNVLSKKMIYAVSPSQWLANCLHQSSLFRNYPIFVCPNVINTEVFRPVDKRNSKKQLNLDENKKYILFGAATMQSLYKGMTYVYETLVKLPLEYEFLVLGKINKEELPISIQNRTHIMGYVDNDEQKRIIYSAADMFLITSIAENYPNMVIESMACGTPVVGFKTGGIVEQIEDRITGCLAPIGDVDALLLGIKWIERNNSDGVISARAREFVVNNCSYEKIEDLYAPLLH